MINMIILAKSKNLSDLHYSLGDNTDQNGGQYWILGT